MQTPFDPNRTSEPSPFEASQFAVNPEARIACLLLLDTSGSMEGEPIEQLNEGLEALKSALERDDLASKRAEIGIVVFGSAVEFVQDFRTIDQITMPKLEAEGLTVMSQAILEGLDRLAQRKAAYKRNGIHSYRPWVFLLTDGAPTDTELWPRAVDRVQRGENDKKFTFYAVAVGNADSGLLRELSPNRAPLRLKGLNFQEFFLWLSQSMSIVSRSNSGDTVKLPPPGWGEAIV